MAVFTSGNASMKDSHWYTIDGDPMHRMTKKSGDGDRATTIKDARELHLLPSVTNYIGVLAKPALDEWKQDQICQTAFSNPPKPGETIKFFTDRTKDMAFEQVRDAADLGSGIHEALDLALDGHPWNPEFSKYVAPVLAWVHEKKLKVTGREETVVNAEEGYAGRTDLFFTWAPAFTGMGILDYKTKKTQPDRKVESYLEHRMQLAAYAAKKYGVDNLKNVLAANVFISTTEVGRVEIIKVDDLDMYYECFLHCCAIWRIMKNYDPRVR